MTHIVCFSGGESSAIVAIEVVRKFGKENVVLLNHDISSKIEHAIALAAISQKEEELENASSFDWSIGHVSHYYI